MQRNGRSESDAYEKAWSQLFEPDRAERVHNELVAWIEQMESEPESTEQMANGTSLALCALVDGPAVVKPLLERCARRLDHVLESLGASPPVSRGVEMVEALEMEMLCASVGVRTRPIADPASWLATLLEERATFDEHLPFLALTAVAHSAHDTALALAAPAHEEVRALVSALVQAARDRATLVAVAPLWNELLTTYAYKSTQWIYDDPSLIAAARVVFVTLGELPMGALGEVLHGSARELVKEDQTVRRAAQASIVRAREVRAKTGRAEDVLAAVDELEPRLSEASRVAMLRETFALSVPTARVLAHLPADGRAGGMRIATSDVLGVVPPRSFPVGAVLGDGRYRVLRELTQNDVQRLCEGETDDLAVRVVLARPRRGAGTHAAHALDVPLVSPILAEGPFAALDGMPGQFLVEARHGTSARRLVRGAMPRADVARWVDVLARVAEAVHARGGSLRGLRPETVDILDGEVEGLSPRAERVFDEAETWGVRVPAFTLTYRAPEALTAPVDSAAADVFLLATLAAEWLTGEHPFHAGSHAEHVARVIGGTPTDPGNAVLLTALSHTPEARPTLAELRAALL